ncbi:MAG: FtsX-like permease family protein [Hydrogenibacillus sp.]|nr:FtsX-like permease family protein [Hydrogenibacillus sp.]
MRDISWRALWRRKKETALTAVLLALVMLFTALELYAIAGYERGIALSEARLGADVVVFAKEAPVDGSAVLFGSAPINAYFDAEAVVRAVERTPGVGAWTPQLFAQTLNADCCSVEGENRLVGIDWTSDFLVKPWVQGAAPEVFSGYEAILGGGVASYEDEIEILGAPFRVVARLLPTGTALDQTIFVPLDTARDLVAHSDTVVETWGAHDPERSLSAIFIRAAERYNPDLLAYQLNRIPDVSVFRTSDVVYGARETFRWVLRLLSFGVASVAVFGMLVIVGRLAGDVRRRQNDFALLIALGAPARRVYGWLAWETFAVTFLAAALAAVVLLILWPPLSGLIESARNQPFVRPEAPMLVLGAAAVVMAVFAVGLVTALFAARGIVRRAAGEVLKEEGGV